MTIAFSNYTEKRPCWSMMNLAHGYLDSALVLCDEIRTLRHPRNGGVYSLLPIINALHQGLENFLKGASLALDENNNPKTSHDLEQLWLEYSKRVSDCSLPADLVVDNEVVRWVSWWDREAEDDTGPGEGPRFLHGKRFTHSYEGLIIDQKEVSSAALSCKNECVRVHIRLIQEFVATVPNQLIHPLQPWWEPNESFQARVEKAREERRIGRAVHERLPKDRAMGSSK